jgi:serine/threonine protein kinase
MVFKITQGTPTRFPQEVVSQSDSDAARRTLSQLARHITAQSEGSKYPGRLIVNNLRAIQRDANDKQIEVRRGGIFRQLFSSSYRVERGNGYLRNLMVAAYKDKISPEHFQQTMTKVDKYLKDNRDVVAFGGRRLVEFVREFEAAPVISQNAVYLDNETNRLITSRKGLRGIEKWDQAFVNIRMAVAHLPGVDTKVDEDGWTDFPSVMTKGQEGVPFSVRINGLENVVKIATNLPPLDPELRQGEVAAVDVPNAMHNVIRPTAYLIRVAKASQESQVYQVPAQAYALRDFLAQQNRMAETTGTTVDFTLHGSIMPRASGQPIDALLEKGPLNEPQFANLATGLYVGVQEMKNNRLVHHDIKPGNVIFDNTTGQTRLIDLGGMVQLGSNHQESDATSSSTVGSPGFQAPASRMGQAHGAEVDRYSYAVTLLSALEPAFASAEIRKHLPNFLGGQLPTQDDPSVNRHDSPDAYLTAYMNALRRLSPEKSAQLQERLTRTPALQQIIHNAFLGSAQSPNGDAAWDQVRVALGALTPSRPNALQLMSTFEHDMLDESNIQAAYEEATSAVSFSYPLSEIDTSALKTQLMHALRARAAVPASNPLRYRALTRDEAKMAIHEHLTALMQHKKDQLATMAQKVNDPALQTIMKKEILFGNFTDEEYELIAKYAQTLKDSVQTLSEGRAVDGLLACRNAFMSLEQEKINGECLSDPWLLATIRTVPLLYAAAKGVNLQAAGDAMKNDEAIRLYGFFSPNRGADNVLAQDLQDPKKAALTAATASDWDTINAFARVMQTHTAQDLVDTMEQAAQPIDSSPSERLGLIDKFYPTLSAQRPSDIPSLNVEGMQGFV